MKTTDFNKKLTSTAIAENIEKLFSVNVDLTKYTREQLEDYRNKLRTRVFQHEGSSKMNELLTNEEYQKDKAMLELLNTRIKEMLGEQMKKLINQMDQLSEAKKGAKPDFLDLDRDGNKKEPMASAAKSAKGKPKKGVNPFAEKGNKPKKGVNPFAKKDKKVKEERVEEKAVSKAQQQAAGVALAAKKTGKKPAGKGAAAQMAKMPRKELEKFAKTKHTGLPAKKDKKADEGVAEQHEPLLPGQKAVAKRIWDAERAAKGAAANAKRQAGTPPPYPVKLKKPANESFRKNVEIVNEGLARFLREDEEGKAKAITAAGDIVNDFTSWMQRVGQYQTKSMIELADSIRANFGQQEAETFKQSVGPALTTALETLTAQREAISNAVAVLAGERPAAVPMGQEPGIDTTAPDALNTPDELDAFAATDAAAGAGSAGREVRESAAERKARMIAEQHSIIARLAK